MESNDNLIMDTDFMEDKYTKYINGKPIFYKTSEVGDMLDESDSTIRFWCTCFKDFLPIQTSGRNRMFRDGDIDKLKFIQKLLREDGLSIQQVKEYCSEKNIDELENKINKESDPLPAKIIATAVAIEVGAQLEDYKMTVRQELLEELREAFIKQEEKQEQLKDFITTTINDKIQSNFDNFKVYIDEKELEANKKDIERLDTLKAHMEEREKQFKLDQEQKKEKGFFGRLFRK